MSRLRRLVVSDRWFFVTCRLLPRRRILTPSEFATLAAVIGERRAEHGFLLTAWVFLPDHWHAIFYPRHPLTISRVMEAIKDGATKRINHSRREAGLLWQPRFFDRALRTGEAAEEGKLRPPLRYPLMRMQASYDIAQTRKRERRIHVRRIRYFADVRA